MPNVGRALPYRQLDYLTLKTETWVSAAISLCFSFPPAFLSHSQAFSSWRWLPVVRDSCVYAQPRGTSCFGSWLLPLPSMSLENPHFLFCPNEEAMHKPHENTSLTACISWFSKGDEGSGIRQLSLPSSKKKPKRSWNVWCLYLLVLTPSCDSFCLFFWSLCLVLWGCPQCQIDCWHFLTFAYFCSFEHAEMSATSAPGCSTRHGMCEYILCEYNNSLGLLSNTYL